MGIKIKTAISIQHRFKSVLLDIFSSAERHHLTHEEVIEEINLRIYQTPEFQRSPSWVKTYLQGYKEHWFDMLYTQKLVWLMYLDGQLRTRKEIDAITKTESESLNSKANPHYQSPFQRIDSDKSRYCWIDVKTGEPLRDKPIDKKWKNENDTGKSERNYSSRQRKG